MEQLSKDYCSTSPCKNGKCLNDKNGYYCQCDGGWTGPQCTQDYNECQDSTVLTCLNGGTCSNVNPPTRFQCSCPAEYYGEHCENKYDDCSPGTCGDHGFCVDGTRTSVGQKKYECQCEKGFELSAGPTPTCVDIDECKNSPCYPGVGCTNFEGGFDCKACPAGMTGNGKYCEDIDECKINNGGCSTSPLVQCRNKSPGFSCDPCPSGYEGDGRYCRKASLCDNQNGGCSPLASCVDNNGVASCKCAPGYVGNGVGADGCKPDGGQPTDCNIDCNNGVCIIQNGKPQCVCYQGFSGANCEQSGDPCVGSPCMNGATCQPTADNSDFICQCTENWSGKRCNEEASECGGKFTSSTGSISYPLTDGENYPPNAKCSWTITVELGKAVHLDFSKFDLEVKHGSRCPDYLEVFDGDSGGGNPVGTYCGNRIPEIPDSTTNIYQLFFSSDSRNQAGGFKLTWSTVDGGCGGVRRDDSGTISSPGFPNPYPANSNCEWFVDVPTTKRIRITFKSVELYGSCTDFVEVYDGVSEDYADSRLAKACGTDVPSPVQTKGPFANIKFVTSGAATTNSGFELQYTTLDNQLECGGDLVSGFGEIESPGYPNKYPKDAMCVWKIVLWKGDHVALTFTDIDIEDNYDMNCVYDFVRVGAGIKLNGELDMKTFCGYHKADLSSQECQPENLPNGAFCRALPETIISQKNALTIEFGSDDSFEEKGFHADYDIGCGGYFDAAGQIYSPDYPNAYPKARECDYKLHSDSSQVIVLTFDTFALGAPAGSDCSKSYVKVYDGANNMSSILLTACENRVPEKIMSSGADLLVQFVTDGNENDHGFLAHFEFELAGCGGVYAEDEGIVRSPGFPVEYPEELKCIWYFRAKNEFIIELEFLMFEFEESDDGVCLDFVSIYDGDSMTPSDNTTLIGTFCDSIPNVVQSSARFKILGSHSLN